MMASNGVSEGNPHVFRGPSALQNSQIPPQEDESEWEYEYSNTETETFYVTLDLSKADFTSREAGSTSHPGYRAGEKFERSKMYLNRRESPGNDDLDGLDNSDEDDEVLRSSEPKGSKKPKEPQEPQPEEFTDHGDDHQVQILDLHSEHPVISYKGRVYSGQWSQNVGTELLLTTRDDENPLPALRHLDNDVELLAASCSRITVREKQLKPREDASNRQRLPGNFNEYRTFHPVVPPPEKWSSRERVDQGNFLANFIALKKRRGETDEVTVIAKGVDPRTNHNRSRKEKQKQGHRGKFNLPHPRGPRRVKRGDFLSTLANREGSMFPSAADEMVGSTPTPLHWDELEEEGEERDEEGEDEMMADDLNGGFGDGEDEELDENEHSGSEEEDEVDDMDVDDT